MSRSSRYVFSLRSVLIFPYVALLLGLAVTIAALSYVAGEAAVLKVSEHLLLETVGRIGQAIDRHVVGSGAVLEAAFPDGMAAPQDISTDIPNLRTRFWIATSLHIDPNNYVYYGNRSGQAIGIFRPSLKEGELHIKVKPQDNRSKYRFDGINGALRYTSTETKLFDPRERPWYKAAAATSTDTWTSIYIDFGTEELVATRARRVLNAAGEFEGVVATDMSLRALNDFVRNLKVSPQGSAFIVEPNGDLIASSVSPNVRRDAAGANARINAMDSGNALLNQIYQHVRDASHAAGAPAGAQTLVFTTDEGQVMHVGYDTITDTGGLHWVTIAAMPSSDFMGGVTENLWRTAIVSALAALVALLLGLWILQWVVRDLKLLTSVAMDIGEGRLGRPIQIERNDEIGALAQSFAIMQHRLQTDRLTGLANRDALERHLNGRISHRRRDDIGVGFGILFIDLDGFKSVNDRYGHDAGDAVLVQMGQRLRGLIISGDVAARYAGDEFVILLQHVEDPAAMDSIRQQIAAELALPLEITSQDGSLVSVQLSAAIGQAHYPTDATDSATLLKLADRDMYRRKNANR